MRHAWLKAHTESHSCAALSTPTSESDAKMHSGSRISRVGIHTVRRIGRGSRMRVPCTGAVKLSISCASDEEHRHYQQIDRTFHIGALKGIDHWIKLRPAGSKPGMIFHLRVN